MFHKISIRWRLTILSALLLSFCCISLTMILNYSAYRLVDQFDAITLTPAIPLGETQEIISEPAQSTMPAYQAQEAKQGFRYESLFYMFFIIVGGSALTYYIAGKALKPLHELNTQVKNINVQTLSKSLSIPTTHDEIADLTASFNQMTDQLNEAFLIQKHFSSSAAHELRTPLAILQTKVDVFQKKENHSKEDYDALLEVVDKQIRRLRTLVGSLLAMSNEVPLEKNEFDLKDSIDDITTELASLAKQKDIHMSFQGTSCPIYGDVDALYRVFYNLIENAIKYNVESGFVEICIDQSDSTMIKVTIKDGASGIPDDMKVHIFEPFYTVDKSRSRALGGVGLGLALANQIVKKHHGSITVSDNTPSGSCFEVCLKKIKA